MSIETIPLSKMGKDLHQTLNECADSGRTMIVELPDHRRVAIHPLDADTEDDDLVNNLIENNPAFRALLARSESSERVPFPFTNG